MPKGKPEDPRPVEIVWGAPPEADRLGMYREALSEIKKRPGQWARVRVWEREHSAYGTRKRLSDALSSDPRWELKVQRTNSNADNPNERGLYIRYRNDAQMEEQ